MDEELWFIESGVRRRAIKSVCDNCGKEFLQRASRLKKRKYCCKKCSDEKRENKVLVFCHTCKKEIERVPSKLKNASHGIYFCCRKCKEVAQSLTGDCPEIRPDHYGTSDGRELYRQYIDRHPGAECISCKENKRFLLLVHHIDGDRSNNIESNLEVVCWNCHIKRHLYMKNGEWSFWTASLTPRDMLDKL